MIFAFLSLVEPKEKLNFEALIKSAVSKRSLQESQGSLAVPVVRQPSRRPLAPLGFLQAALAADLITS